MSRRSSPRHQDPKVLDVLDDTCVQGLLETWVLTSKVTEVLLAAALARLLGGHGSVQGIAHGLIRSRQEDDLAVGRLGHGLHGLEVADLHGGGGAENIGGLTHELGGFDLEGSALVWEARQYSKY